MQLTPSGVVAGVALVIAASSWLRPMTSQQVTPGDARVNDLQAEVFRLRGELDDTRSALTRVSSTASWSAALAPPTPDRVVPAPTEPPAPSPFVHTDAPRTLTIEQGRNGSIAVHNTDPKLAGQAMVVSFERADGSKGQLTIMVPDVGR